MMQHLAKTKPLPASLLFVITSLLKYPKRKILGHSRQKTLPSEIVNKKLMFKSSAKVFDYDLEMSEPQLLPRRDLMLPINHILDVADSNQRLVGC